MNWQIGDRAICTYPKGKLCGLVVEIISGLRTHQLVSCTYHTVDPGFPPEPHTHWAVEPQYLKPIPDANETTTWGSMEDIWIPEELVTV